jgi:hypothetical protein
LNTEDVQIPGAFPVGSDNASEAGTSQENSDESERISNDIRNETLPPAPIYNSRLQDGLKAVKHHLAGLANTMHLSELTQDQSTSLHTLWKRTEKMSKFEYPETRTVGFIGDSGVGMDFLRLLMFLIPSSNVVTGKSSLINSLLDQKIARSVCECYYHLCC